MCERNSTPCRVLLTNLYLQRYTGSELYLLELAELFEAKGYEVTIAVFRASWPLLGRVKPGWRLVCLPQDALPETEYDFVFAQHFPVLDYILARQPLRYRWLAVSKLSALDFVVMEQLPAFAASADVILCVSRECEAAVHHELGDIGRQKTMLFPNCAPAGAFEAFDKAGSSALRRIAVISNHVPDELKTLQKHFLLTKIDYIGMEGEPRFVDAALLKQYDLVVTIGRTVQLCMACGVPIYVYDRFGGPGYLTPENFALAADNNFSGRGGFSPKTTAELAKDIKNGYRENYSRRAWLHCRAEELYHYQKRFDEVYAAITAHGGEWKTLSAGNLPDGKRLEYYTGLFAAYGLNHMNGINSQLFWDTGTGFSEQESLRWNVAEGYRIRRVLAVPSSARQFRFDPADGPCQCRVLQAAVNKTPVCLRAANASGRADGFDLFTDSDPQYEPTSLPEGAGQLQVEYIVKPLAP